MKHIAIWTTDQIEKLKQNAEKNVVPFEEVKKLSKGDPLTIPGDDENHTILIAPYYKAVYTHEEQQHGILRHLSISSNISEYPPQELVIVLMNDLGFINSIDKCAVWPENFGSDSCIAINVVEPIDGDWEPHRKK